MNCRMLPWIAVLLVSCGKEPKAGEDAEMHDWERLHAVQYYWADGMRGEKLDSLAKRLDQMGEPVLWREPTVQPAQTWYRFVRLPTFGSATVVTLEPRGEDFVTRWRVFSGQSGFQVGPVEREAAQTNKSEFVSSLVAELDRRLVHAPEYDGEIGVDGETWIIEGVKNGRHHLVHRWSPSSGWVREIGARFLTAAGLPGP